MSFISSKPIEKKTAHDGIMCFKIVKVHESGKITSVYFPSCEYTIGELTKEIPLVKEETPSPYRLMVREGYSSYDSEIVKYDDKGKGFYQVKAWTTLLDGKEHTLEAMSKPSPLMANGNPFTYKVMMCVIPKGSEYFEDEYGTMISNFILPMELLK